MGSTSFSLTAPLISMLPYSKSIQLLIRNLNLVYEIFDFVTILLLD